jgi:hypothetical protein
MNRRGFFSILLPSAAGAQALGTLSSDCHLKTTAKGDLACYRIAEVVPYGGFLCECGNVMWHEKTSDGSEAMKCLNTACKNHNILFMLPTMKAVEKT